MKRKLVEQGKTTLMISLPIDWIRKFGLQKGDEIEVDEQGGELVIKTEKSFKQNNKVIDLAEYGFMKKRAILTSYLQGVDELELKFIDIKQIKEIEEKILNELIGFEIIKQTPNSLILKDISGSSEQNFDMILKRTFLIIESMGDELVKSLENRQKNLEHVIMMDKEVNKLSSYSIRILNKKGYKDFKKIPIIYSILLELEFVGNYYRYVAHDIMEKQMEITAADIQNLKLVNKLFGIFSETFFSHKKEGIMSLRENYEKLKKNLKGNKKMDMYSYQALMNIMAMTNNLLLIF